MPSFAYSAINSQGTELAGEIQASDLAAAQTALRGDGLLAQWIEELKSPASGGGRSFGKKKVQAKSLQIFSRQFATMVEAGLSVVTALVILEQQTDDKALAEVIDEIRERVETGSLLSEAMALHPDVFSRLYVAMVEAGEAAGVLDTVLDRVAIQIEKEKKLKRRIKGAMMYPGIVLVFATLVMVGMLMFLVPIFVKIFATLGGELPTLTQYVMHASNLLRGYWYIIFPAVGATIWGFFRWKKTRVGRADLGPVQAADPDADRRRRPQGSHGEVVAHAFDARRIRRRHHAGPRDHCPDRRKLGCRARDDETTRAGEEGSSIAQPLIESEVFPPMVSQMMKIGEETGELEKMLSKVADFYEDEVDASVQALTSIIEPLMMVGVGVMVGIIIISMYLPMFKMLSLVK